MGLPTILPRPWHRETAEADADCYSDYAGWETWLANSLDANPCADACPLDALDTFQRIDLYAVMCRVADGQAGPRWLRLVARLDAAWLRLQRRWRDHRTAFDRTPPAPF